MGCYIWVCALSLVYLYGGGAINGWFAVATFASQFAAAYISYNEGQLDMRERMDKAKWITGR